jgi:hypothetical protein
MHRQLCGRKGEDQPSVGRVDGPKAEHIPEKRAVGARGLAEDDDVRAEYHVSDLDFEGSTIVAIEMSNVIAISQPKIVRGTRQDSSIAAVACCRNSAASSGDSGTELGCCQRQPAWPPKTVKAMHTTQTSTVHGRTESALRVKGTVTSALYPARSLRKRSSTSAVVAVSPSRGKITSTLWRCASALRSVIASVTRTTL